jgi:hypothetical protein
VNAGVDADIAGDADGNAVVNAGVDADIDGDADGNAVVNAGVDANIDADADGKAVVDAEVDADIDAELDGYADAAVELAAAAFVSRPNAESSMRDLSARNISSLILPRRKYWSSNDKTSQLPSLFRWNCSRIAPANSSGVHWPLTSASSHACVAPSLPARGRCHRTGFVPALTLISSYSGVPSRYSDRRRYRRFRRALSICFIRLKCDIELGKMTLETMPEGPVLGWMVESVKIAT